MFSSCLWYHLSDRCSLQATSASIYQPIGPRETAEKTAEKSAEISSPTPLQEVKGSSVTSLPSPSPPCRSPLKSQIEIPKSITPPVNLRDQMPASGIAPNEGISSTPVFQHHKRSEIPLCNIAGPHMAPCGSPSKAPSTFSSEISLGHKDQNVAPTVHDPVVSHLPFYITSDSHLGDNSPTVKITFSPHKRSPDACLSRLNPNVVPPEREVFPSIVISNLRHSKEPKPVSLTTGQTNSTNERKGRCWNIL